MKLMDRNFHILFFRPTPWESDVECSTKVLAKRYAKKGFEVTYLENPMDPLHLVNGNGYFNIWKNAQRWEDNIWIANTFSLIPVRDIYPLNTRMMMSLKYRLCLPSLNTVVTRSGRKVPDIIWTTVPGSGYLKKVFPDALLLFHVIDYYPAFRGKYISAIEKHDYEVADHVFLIGESMKEYIVQDLNISEEKVTVLGQGVDLEKYKNILSDPEDLRKASKPRAVWCGVTKKGDEKLFNEAASVMQSIGGSLVLIGPECEWVHELQDRFQETVFVLGSKPPEQVSVYLKCSDLGLMLYDRGRHDVYFGQNPLKLYEYAAAGLPIISTNHKEYDYLDVPVIVVEKESDIASAIHDALENSDSYAEKSLEFVAKKSWDVQVETSLKCIRELS